MGRAAMLVLCVVGCQEALDDGLRASAKPTDDGVETPNEPVPPDPNRSGCGNGIVELGETCDGNCTATCDDGDACTQNQRVGAAATCDAGCVFRDIVVCRLLSDGCCPDGCDPTSDGDCGAECGNGIVDATELCDGNCPTTCPPSLGCDALALVGAGTCRAECVPSGVSVCGNSPSPIAIAKLRAADPANPNANYTIANDIGPLDRVYLDGRAKGTVTSTHDPSSPANTARIASYLWEVLEAPPGLNPDDFAPQGAGTGLYSLFLPLAGHYVVRLTVANADGLASADTVAARVVFDAIPRQRLHIQLVWDNPANDQDLHVTYADIDDRLCGDLYDCHWLNVQPVWFGTYAAGEGANPHLDIDDTDGLGPENINIDNPVPGTYRVYVHYYAEYTSGSAPATLNTVRVWFNGVQVAAYERALFAVNDVWAVADIEWHADNTGTIAGYPIDTSGQVGAISRMPDCASPGWTFP